jgi:hypothetical protein
MSVYKKLQEARVMLHHTQLNKSGKNKFANFNYFELGDFIPQVTDIFNKVVLCGVVSLVGFTPWTKKEPGGSCVSIVKITVLYYWQKRNIDGS